MFKPGIVTQIIISMVDCLARSQMGSGESTRHWCPNERATTILEQATAKVEAAKEAFNQSSDFRESEEEC
jgi:catalase (peroxidase I)